MSNPWEATELFGKMLGEYTDNGYRQGVYEERERIIALLESHMFDPTVNPPSVLTWNRHLRFITKLIKEENE